jgi:DNA uptake protein ComE-like DNA-binding protein
VRQGGRLTLPPSNFSRVGICALVVVAVLGASAVHVAARGGSKDWVVLENCHLITNPANDGDSFHVSAGPKEYLFRLYLVDAPETDARNPTRLVEQAKYFSVTVPQVIEVGEAAKEFIQGKLSMPFTVLTHLSDAMGQSRLERFYALVETKEGDLGEQLVRNGLARNYGFKVVPPGLTSWRIEVEKLQQFEDEAKREKIGAWGTNAGRLNARAQTASAFSSFVVDGKTRSRSAPTDVPAVFPPVAKPAKSIARSPVEMNGSRAKGKTPLGNIDINTATEKELTTVPGIGHVMAARIIAARPFRSADDLKRVSGIGEKKYAQIRSYFQ